MIARLLRALCPFCLLALAFASAGGARAQAPGGGSSLEDPSQITSTGTPRDVSPAPSSAPLQAPSPAPAPITTRTTPPPERPSLVAMLEPLWVDLSDAQQRALAPFAPEWNTWPMAEKKSWVALADKLPSMSPERQEKARRRILEWANLTPEQRRVARANYRLAKERPAQKRVEEWQSYQSMTQEQREVLRKAGSTSNTAAGHAGAPTGLANEASQPLPRIGTPPLPGDTFVPTHRRLP
jgi:hypothetical protein